MENVRSWRAIAAENKPLGDALARQLGALTKYIEEMQYAQPADLGVLGAVWAGALGQLAVDMGRGGQEAAAPGVAQELFKRASQVGCWRLRTRAG